LFEWGVAKLLTLHPFFYWYDTSERFINTI
jgi:hypothetical protein